MWLSDEEKGTFGAILVISTLILSAIFIIDYIADDYNNSIYGKPGHEKRSIVVVFEGVKPVICWNVRYQDIYADSTSILVNGAYVTIPKQSVIVTDTPEHIESAVGKLGIDLTKCNNGKYEN